MLEQCLFPTQGSVPALGLQADAAAWQASLATCKVVLFKDGLIVTNTTTLAEVLAVECDFDGYTAGGVAVAALNDPFKEADGSFTVYSPLVQINYVDGATHTANSVGGFAVVDTGGVCRGIFKFADPISVAANTDAVPIVFGRNFANAP